MQVSGKLLIIGIFGVALVGVALTLWFQYDARRRSREFWGNDNAVIIGRAPKVELLDLRKSDGTKVADSDQLTIDGAVFDLDEQKDISKAPGLVHVRDALIRDQGFQWDRMREDCQPEWEYAFRFTNEDANVIVALDVRCERVQLVPDGREANISPMYQGIKELINRQFAQVHANKFWGTENAKLIGGAAKVELLHLRKSDGTKVADSDQLTIDGAVFDLDEQKDISKARGVVRVRDELIRDQGFQWDRARGNCQAQWRYAFRFAEEDASVIVALDVGCQRVRLVPGGPEADIAPMYQGIKDLIDREFRPAKQDAAVAPQ